MRTLIGTAIGAVIGYSFASVLHSAGLDRSNWQLWVAVGYLAAAQALGAFTAGAL